MTNYIFLVIFGLLTIWNVVEIIRGIREQIDFEIYAHLGVFIFFATLFISFLSFSTEIFVATFQRNLLGIEAIRKWIGLTIMVIATFLFVLALVAFKSKGTDRVITSGIFKYVRHPMRLSMLILAFGLTLWRLSIALVFAYLLLIVCASIATGKEEKFLLEKFGDKYRDYMARTPSLKHIGNVHKLWHHKDLL